MPFQRQLLRGSVVVGFFSLLSAFSGILVETSIAANLGLSIRSDTFYVAYTIPYIISNLLTATSQFSLVPFFPRWIRAISCRTWAAASATCST